MIDTHIHLVPPNLPGVGALHPVLKQPTEHVADAINLQMTLAEMTHVLAMGEWGLGEADPLGIEKTLAFADLVPGLMVAGICDPTRSHDSAFWRKVEQEASRGRIAALKCYLGYLHYEPAHPNYRKYYELAARYRLPVIFHTGDTFSPEAKLKYAHPLGVDEVAVDHPKTNFVLAHLGNPWMLDAAQVVYKNVNVWADLSGLLIGDGIDADTPDARDTLSDVSTRLRAAIRYAERPNRFLFGTDWPLIPIPAYRDFLRTVVPRGHHPQVFDESARLLFRLA